MFIEKTGYCILCGSANLQPNYSIDKSIMRCYACGHIFDNPRPTQEAIKEFYSKNEKYNPWIENEQKLNEQWLRMLERIRTFFIDTKRDEIKKRCPGLDKSLIPGDASGRLLDIGAGIGHFIHVASRFFDVYGTELSREAVKVAKEKYDVKIYNTSLDGIEFGENSFDIITMHQVLEHVPYPGETIKECHRLLKKDGLLYISVPNEAWYSLRRLIPGIAAIKGCDIHGNRKIDFETMQEIHLSHFEQPVLEDYLKENGFEIIGSGIDFIDPMQYGKLYIQIVRYTLFGISKLIYKLFKKNCYNCFWIMAKKTN